jgi:hypothetical protein
VSVGGCANSVVADDVGADADADAVVVTLSRCSIFLASVL